VTVEFKSKLKSVIKQKSTDFWNKFNNQAYSIILSNAALFKKSQKLEFLSILKNKHTVYSLWAFVARCLLSLIYKHLKHKPKCDFKQKKSMPLRVLKLTLELTRKTSIQRSNRINKPNTPSIRQNSRRRSNRIKPNTPSIRQNSRRRSDCINKPNTRSRQVTFRTRLANVLTTN
jgi:hypothetical protein